MTDQSIVAANVDAIVMRSAPINPDWILEGTPVARVGDIVKSTDRTTNSAVWDCTAGTFNWYFGIDETVHILDGEVEVSAPGFGKRILRAGDVALFRAGTTARWHVPVYVRKIAFCRHPLPWPMGVAARALSRVRSFSLRPSLGLHTAG
ncbi:MAG: cupin domain-containing protein [Mesorhizobium sp.]